MTDPIGLINNTPNVAKPAPPTAPDQGGTGEGPSFKDMLLNQINEVNRLQKDATEAMEDLAAGRRNDVESVIIATQKADTAFRMLLQVRNKVMDAYEEVKQIRV
jgi:flagellar hook-basal body complex protein FliE